jgi:hypothetical protein
MRGTAPDHGLGVEWRDRCAACVRGNGLAQREIQEGPEEWVMAFAARDAVQAGPGEQPACRHRGSSQAEDQPPVVVEMRDQVTGIAAERRCGLAQPAQPVTGRPFPVACAQQ